MCVVGIKCWMVCRASFCQSSLEMTQMKYVAFQCLELVTPAWLCRWMLPVKAVSLTYIIYLFILIADWVWRRGRYGQIIQVSKKH